MAKLSDEDTKRVWDRRDQLRDDPHLHEQVSRVMGPLEAIRGTAEVPSYDNVVDHVALGVALLEFDDSKEIIYGIVNVARQSGSGWMILINAATVYELRLQRGPA